MAGWLCISLGAGPPGCGVGSGLWQRREQEGDCCDFEVWMSLLIPFLEQACLNHLKNEEVTLKYRCWFDTLQVDQYPSWLRRFSCEDLTLIECVQLCLFSRLKKSVSACGVVLSTIKLISFILCTVQNFSLDFANCGIMWEFSFSYIGDCEIHMDISKFNLGVKGIQVRAVLTLSVQGCVWQEVACPSGEVMTLNWETTN